MKPIFTFGANWKKERLCDFRQVLIRDLKNYHIIIYSCLCKEPKIQVFYEKDFKEMDFEELKKMIENEKSNN